MRRRLRKKLIALMRDEPRCPEHAIARRYVALLTAALVAPAVVPEDVVRHGLARVHAWPKVLRATWRDSVYALVTYRSYGAVGGDTWFTFGDGVVPPGGTLELSVQAPWFCFLRGLGVDVGRVLESVLLVQVTVAGAQLFATPVPLETLGTGRGAMSFWRSALRTGDEVRAVAYNPSRWPIRAAFSAQVVRADHANDTPSAPFLGGAAAGYAAAFGSNAAAYVPWAPKHAFLGGGVTMLLRRPRADAQFLAQLTAPVFRRLPDTLRVLRALLARHKQAVAENDTILAPALEDEAAEAWTALRLSPNEWSRFKSDHDLDPDKLVVFLTTTLVTMRRPNGQ